MGAGLSRVIGQLADWTRALNEGETGREVPGLARKDELGVLARSMVAIHQRGEEAARIRTALDDSSAMIMLADNDQNIVFVNKALLDS